MEKLSQKYMKYFYISLIVVILIRLVLTIYMILTMGFPYEFFISIALCIVNLFFLFDSTKHNIRQQFTECKMDAKILRFTLFILMGFNMLLYFRKVLDWTVLTDYALIISTIEIVLTHRIASIEYLEKLANRMTRNDNIIN